MNNEYPTPRAAAQPMEVRLHGELDLSALRNLADPAQLTTLRLCRCKVSDLAPLVELPQLTSLSLWYCHLVRDLSSLAKLPRLTMLALDICPQVSDLSPLAGLTQLVTLDQSWCTQLGDLSPLAGLTQLTTLDLRGNGRRLRAGRLRVLAGLPQLTIVR